MTLTVAPIFRDEALAWISRVHSHLPKGQAGWLFGVQVLDDGRRCCVGVLVEA